MKVVWTDKKRVFGVPLSLTEYTLYDNRLTVSKGLLFYEQRDVLLWEVDDVIVQRTLWQLFMGVGNVVVFYRESKRVVLENVVDPVKVKDVVFSLVRKAKYKHKRTPLEVWYGTD